MRAVIGWMVLLCATSSSAGESESKRCLLKDWDTQYIANFQYGDTKKMQIRLGGKKKWVAEIFSNQSCKALCEVKQSSEQVFDLRCQSSEFHPLAVPATLFLAAGAGRYPRLRFGSWLQGYQEARLSVEQNRIQNGIKVK